jgi:RNA 2',3'-cyclic 3'-phosphodiesterase
VSGPRQRAFLALDLDAAARGRLATLVDTLRPQLRGVRWVRPEGVHLTLRFLGWSEPDALAHVEARVSAAACASRATQAPLGPLGMFPERGSPRVLWLGLPLPEPLQALQQVCERAACEAGFEPEARPFAPHLTLGRWKDRHPRPSLPSVDMGLARLDRLVLFRSDLRRDGAVYTPLRVFPLAA